MNRPPFIGTQRLSQLNCTPGEELKFLRDEHFVPFPADDRRQVSEMGNRNWVPVPDRVKFLKKPGCSRLVLTIEGGIGKTTALEQIAYLRASEPIGHLCISTEFADLPLRESQFLGAKPPTEDEQQNDRPCLVRWFRGYASTKSADGALVWSLIQRKIRQSQFTLLVDALDQVDLEDQPSPMQKVEALAAFLRQNPNVACVVTGRPYAVSHYWRKLTKGTGPWKLAAVGPFTPDEAKRYLGADRFEAVRTLGAEVLSVPRGLQRLRTMHPTELAKLRTASDVYWESFEKILRDGCQDQKVMIREDAALGLLALLAFEMLRQNKLVRVPPGAEFEEFCQRVLTRRRGWLESQGATDLSKLHELLIELNKLNIVIEHAVADMRNVSEIRWPDRTVQDFFAAIWLTRYAAGAADIMMAPASVNDGRGATNRQRDDLDDREWFASVRPSAGWETIYTHASLWRLVCGMPPDPRVWDRKSYVRMVSTAYLPSPVKDVDADVFPPSARSTEMIWRSWPHLLHIANLLPNDQWDEGAVLRSTLELQQDTYHAVQKNSLKFSPLESLPEDASAAARQVMQQFLAEFPAIRFGHYQPSDQPRAREIATEFDAEWFPVVIDQGSFYMGYAYDHEEIYDNAPEHIGETHRSYRPAKYPVTNELYRLFFPEHVNRYEDYSTYSDGDRCPAIYINFFDAWVASLWLHGYLLDEYEWERACRGAKAAAQRTKWWYGDQEDELGKYAWYYANSGNRTHPVDSRSARVSHPDDKLPNDLGLYHMHGNVLEWTSSWYHEDPREGRKPEYRGWERVLRGGCFGSLAIQSRCESRFEEHPQNPDYDFGFRVSRVSRPS